jgi:hypothetical protein
MKKCLSQGIFRGANTGGGGASVFELWAKYFVPLGKSIEGFQKLIDKQTVDHFFLDNEESVKYFSIYLFKLLEHNEGISRIIQDTVG